MQPVIVVGARGDLSAKDLLYLAQNPDQLKATLTQIEGAQKVLREQHEGLDAKVALAGKADEIIALREQIGKDAAEAASAREAAAQHEAETRERAKADAEAVIKAAKTEAANIIGMANTQAAQIREAAETEKRNAAGRTEAANRRQAEVSTREAAVAARETTLTAAEAEAKRVREEFEAKHARLSEALKGVA